MADREYSITIEVKQEETSENKSPIAGDKKEKEDSEVFKDSGILNKEQAKAAGKVLTAYHFAKSFTDQIISHNVSMVELNTGSKELQDRANFNLQVGQKLAGMVESVTMGALVGGWVGAIAGIAVGTVSSAINYTQAQERLDKQKAIEDTSLQMNYIRAGAGGSRRQ